MKTTEKIKIKAREVKNEVRNWIEDHEDGLKAVGAFAGLLLGSAGLGYLKGRQATQRDMVRFAEHTHIHVYPPEEAEDEDISEE